MKKKILGTVLCALLLMTAAPAAACSSGKTGDGGLIVSGISTSISKPSSEQSNTQTYNYRVTFQNNSDTTIYIESIEPQVKSQVESRLLVAGLIKSVNRNVPGGGNIEVTSIFPFDATGMTKEDIAKLEPFIIGFKVTSDETLPIPGQKS
jgi:hypothetical protein